MEYVLQTNNLTKKYKNKKVVDNVNINIKCGEIYGFVGRNGAGKTTFMKMITGLIAKTSGEITLFGATGSDINKHRRRIGNLIEDPGIYPGMTAKENLRIKSKLMGINSSGYEESLLELVGLKDVGRKKVKSFSLGMKQRLGIALSLVGEPDFLILDEPINGLDPQGIADIRALLLRLRDEKNMTIMISSHILDELYKLADTFCIIDNGVVIEELSKEELDEKNSEYIRIIVDNVDKATTILDELKITEYKVKDNNHIHVKQKLDMSAIINKKMVESGLMVSEITVVRDSIEKFYLGITGGNKND